MACCCCWSTSMNSAKRGWVDKMKERYALRGGSKNTQFSAGTQGSELESHLRTHLFLMVGDTVTSLSGKQSQLTKSAIFYKGSLNIQKTVLCNLAATVTEKCLACVIDTFTGVPSKKHFPGQLAIFWSKYPRWGSGEKICSHEIIHHRWLN